MDFLRPGPFVTTRFLRLLAWQLLLMFACVLTPAYASDDVDITHASIEAGESGYKLAASFAFDLNHDLEDAVQHGMPLYFTTRIELTRPRWYWFDQKAVVAKQTIRLGFDVLTRRYQVSINGGVMSHWPTLDEALLLIRRPSRWVVAQRGALQPGETYNVKLSMGMDPDYLPKPIQVNALNNKDWSLSSSKKTFPYTAE